MSNFLSTIMANSYSQFQISKRFLKSAGFPDCVCPLFNFFFRRLLPQPLGIFSRHSVRKLNLNPLKFLPPFELYAGRKNFFRDGNNFSGVNIMCSLILFRIKTFTYFDDKTRFFFKYTTYFCYLDIILCFENLCSCT